MCSSLSDEAKARENKLVKIIADAVAVDCIYLLGYRLQSGKMESIFTGDGFTHGCVDHYFLLVLSDGTRSCNYVQDKIENTCRGFIPVTVIVIHTSQFMDWVRSGNRFAVTVIGKAVQFYGTGVPALEVICDGDKAGIEKIDFDKGSVMAKEFLAGAEFYISRKQNCLAAFMLHQSAEHALQSILKCGTGLYVNTHSLDKLLRYCALVSDRVAEVFSGDDSRLLQVLQAAYVDGRYNAGYTISYSDLVVILERVRELVEVTDEVAKGRSVNNK